MEWKSEIPLIAAAVVLLTGLACGIQGLAMVQAHSWGESYVSDGVAKILFGIVLILLGNALILVRPARPERKNGSVRDRSD